ncbi:MAG: hypothetical protein AB1724_07865 [Thermodesulfobacteriota bacterium]
MNTSHDRELQAVHGELKRLIMDWAADKTVDGDRARRLRQRAVEINHRRYRENIPYYRKVCRMADLDTDNPGLDNIIAHLMVTDDIFKSYPQSLVDGKNFEGMTAWLSRISTVDLTGQLPGDVRNLDQWIEALAAKGMNLVFSSGTSGNMSFVPRDEATWTHFLKTPLLYLPLLIAEQGMISPWKYWLLKRLIKMIQPDAFLKMADKFGRFVLKDYDGYFCNFSGGNQGIQLVGQEIAKYCGSAFFLYDMTLSPAAVRGIIRGAHSPEEQTLADEFLRATVFNKEANYDRMIGALQESVRRRRKVIVFGTPYLLLEICQKIKARQISLKVRKGSGVIFGGGWKSFDGRRIPEEELVRLLSETFGLEPRHIAEGYSMTEIHGLMLRCSHKRYHVPPHFETVILDESLKPLAGDDVTGALGIIDPFAESYPGFLVTGDTVRRINAPCPCGRSGPMILSIERSAGREVKGCGGIMAKINA